MNLAREAALASFFDRCAQQGLMQEFEPQDEPKLARLLAIWDVASGERVLEPGCGAGRLTIRLARAVSAEGAVIGFDLSTEMLRLAARRGLPPQAIALRASVMSIPLRDESIDQVICFNSFPHFEDAPRAVAEMKRVLKPGGRLWIAHLESRDVVNQRHIEAASEVGGHLLPPADELAALLAGYGLLIGAFSDDSGGYYVNGTRPA